MKVIFVVVILFVGLCYVYGRPEEFEASAEESAASAELSAGLNNESNAGSEHESIVESNEDSSTNKTKRGILNYAYGYGYDHLHTHVPHAHVHSVSAGSSPVYVGLHKHASASPYARFPGIHKSINSPSGHIGLTHGGASVHSYSVNYPRAPIVATKPLLHHHHHVSVVPIARPAFVPVTSTPVVVPQRPIIPVAYPHHHHHLHRIPVFVHKHPVIVQRPITPVSTIPIAPTVPAVHHHHVPAQFPIVPTSFVPHVHPVVSTPNFFSTVSAGHVHPQFFPVPAPAPFPAHQPASPIPFFPANVPNVPNTIGTPEAFPQPGTTLFSGSDGWRPIVVSSELPNGPTTNINRPNIGLLPPYLEQSPSNSQGEIQPTIGEPVHTQQPQTPSGLYLTPSEVNQLDGGNYATNSEGMICLRV